MKQKQLQKITSQARKLDIGQVIRFLSKHGVLYESKEPPSSVLAFLEQYPLRAFPLAKCRSNAARLALDAAEVGLALSYVEGLAMHGQGSRPQLHAWNAIDGVLIDLTWGALVFEQHQNGIYVHRRGRIVGEIPWGYAYHGVEVPVEMALESDGFTFLQESGIYKIKEADNA